MKLTKRAIDAIVPDPRRDIYVWDEEVRGFLLRVKPSGVRSFAIQYRNASGVSRRITIGKLGVLTAEEARKLAKQKLADVTKGDDPAEARSEDRKTMTVRQLCQTYLNACEKGLILGKGGRPKKASTLYIDRGRIERHILALLGGRRIRDLRTPDISRFMRDVATGKTANDIRPVFAVAPSSRGAPVLPLGLLGSWGASFRLLCPKGSFRPIRCAA
jgi:Arm domain-containing DNA-binding protein